MSWTPPTESVTVVDPTLLERGRLALQSLKYREQAARYRAAYATLLEAIAEAELGNDAALKGWLSGRSGGVLHATEEPEAEEPEADPRERAAVPESGTSTAGPSSSGSASPWDVMRDSAIERSLYWGSRTEPASPVVASESLCAEIADGLRSPSHPPRKRWWAAPHILISMAAHGLLVLAFSLWIIARVQEPQVLSIAAATIETDDVLMETPMEMPQALEAPSASEAAMPSLEDLSVPVDLPTIAAPNVDLGPAVAQVATSSSLGNSVALGTASTLVLEGAEFFGSKAVGNNFAYVVDSSPSMLRDGAFDAAKTEIVRSLQSLKPKQRFYVTFFGKELDPLRFPGSDPERYAIRATAENLEKALTWIGRVAIQKDGRAPLDALQNAIAMQPDAIFLLFDGDTKVDRWTSKIREMNRVDDLLSDDSPRVPIHVVHFFREEFEKEMRTLAAENGGTYRFVPRPEKPLRGQP